MTFTDRQQLDLFGSIPEPQIVHTHENNSESEQILNDNKDHLNKQCKLVHDLLKKGIRLTVRDAIVTYGISSLPRRILDLKQSGIEVKSVIINKRFKEYFL